MPRVPFNCESAYFDELVFRHAAHAALVGAVAHNSVAADLAYPYRGRCEVLSAFDRIKSLLVQTVMDLFDRHGVLEAGGCGLVSLGLGFGDKSGVHALELVGLSGDGGFARLVWMPRSLKEELHDRLVQRSEEIGIPSFYEMIADETIGVTEEDIIPFLTEVGHPALTMDSIL